jgi:hypothetical protein
LGFSSKERNAIEVFYPKKNKKLWFFSCKERKECSCGFSSKEINVFMTIAFSRALSLRFCG